MADVQVGAVVAGVGEELFPVGRAGRLVAVVADHHLVLVGERRETAHAVLREETVFQPVEADEILVLLTLLVIVGARIDRPVEIAASGPLLSETGVDQPNRWHCEALLHGGLAGRSKHGKAVCVLGTVAGQERKAAYEARAG